MKVLFRFYPITLEEDKSFYIRLPKLPQVGDYISSDLLDESVRKHLSAIVNKNAFDLTEAPLTFVRGREFTEDKKIVYWLGFNPNRIIGRYKTNDKSVFQEFPEKPCVGDFIYTAEGAKQVKCIEYSPGGVINIFLYEDSK